MSKIITEENILLIFLSFAAYYFLSATLGGINHYSAVPYLDMWRSFEFYKNVLENNFGAWWAQHNEHRIVLSRILFLLDFKWFSGSAKFLISCNFLLAGLAFFVVYSALRENLKQNSEKFARHLIGLLIFCLLFSWMQRENFTWEFQSQFFLAQLIPLGAFLLLYKAQSSLTHATMFFLLACLVGILAIGTMANGVITLPLMLILAVVLGMKNWQIATLFTLSILTLGIYFYGYSSPEGHGQLSTTVLNDPLGLLHYVLTYLGNPVYYLPVHSIMAAQIAGIFLILSAVYFLMISIRKPKDSSLSLALVTFLIYISGTALVTGGGRLFLGIEQAISSRYTTPVLLAWSVLLVLYAPIIARQASIHLYRIVPLVFIPLLLLPQQFIAFHPKSEMYFEYLIALLAIELGVDDVIQVSTLNPILPLSADESRAFINIAAQNDLSVFNNPLIKDAVLLIGQKAQISELTTCVGGFDKRVEIFSDPHYRAVSGWLYNSKNKTVPPIIHILNDEGVVVGYALTGQRRETLLASMGKKAEFSGFKGYILSDQKGPLLLQGVQNCDLKVMLQ